MAFAPPACALREKRGGLSYGQNSASPGLRDDLGRTGPLEAGKEIDYDEVAQYEPFAKSMLYPEAIHDISQKPQYRGGAATQGESP